jgi:hypothetical protein
MGDIVLKRLQVGNEGAFTAGATSVYNGGSAVTATRRLAVELASEFGYADLTYDSTEEARGTYAGTYTHALQMRSVKGKFGGLLYPDDMIYYLRGTVSGAPTVATLPTAPTALLAATAIASTMSLTTQPNATADGALAKILAVTLANGTTNCDARHRHDHRHRRQRRATDRAGGLLRRHQTPSKVGGGAGALTVTLYTQNYFKTVGASGIAARPPQRRIRLRWRVSTRSSGRSFPTWRPRRCSR